MRNRRLKKIPVEGKTIVKSEIVWFGSYGKDENGNAKFYNKDNKHDNFSENKEAIADLLNQELSVLKNELWYNYNFGLPIFEKQKSKITIDSSIISIVQSHKEVTNINYFKSFIQDKKYFCDMIINTIYGDINITL